MYKIFKRKLFPNKTEYRLPSGSQLVAFAQDPKGDLCIWFKFQEAVETEYELKYFRIFGTGHDIPEEFEYLGTAVHGDYVWHLHESMSPAATVHSIGDSI